MTILLGIDFETSGLDTKTDKIIEAGFCLWDTERGPLEMKSYIIRQDVQITDEIIKITGITQSMVEDGFAEERLRDDLFHYARVADFFVAHNTHFEIAFLKDFLAGYGADIDHVKWIDTLTDLPGCKGGKLGHMAADNNILNPFPHRALPDVLTMLTLLSKFEFTEVVRHAQAPTVRLRVRFPYDPGKVAGIKAVGGWRWDNEDKSWFKDTKDFQKQDEIDKVKAAGFQVYAYGDEKGEVA